MDFEERYKKLNNEQKEAVDNIDGPMLVLAGPGSGKTEILSMRVARILKKTDIGPSGILCLTFTENASFNMRERLLKLIGTDAYKVGIFTFHSFATHIISDYPSYFWNSALFLPADDALRYEILEEIFKNLPLSDPLSSYHPKENFVFLKYAKDNIANLKRAGISVEVFKKIVLENEKNLKEINSIISKSIPERISKKDLVVFKELAEKIKKIKSKEVDYFIKPINISFVESLVDAIERSEETLSSKPLTEWKSKNIQKNDDGSFSLKDLLNVPKMNSLSNIYALYEEKIHKEGYFDFEDMIIKVIEALEKNKGLLLDVMERYQYILVDEFQDTNKAQMKILSLLTRNEYNEGKPNIMAVGDDDQSIFKFQGAEIENILFFKDNFKDPKVVVLNKNYRSTKNILDVADKVIIKSSKSLRKILPNISKKSVSAISEDILPNSHIHFKSFDSDESEYLFVSKEIKRLINSGIKPEEIAVIGRKHRHLKSLSDFLKIENIDFSYNKKENVLEDILVRQIIVILKFIDSMLQVKEDEANNFLPEILSFPFWQIERKDIWQLSIFAKEDYKSNWILAMQNSQNDKIKKIADFLLELSVLSKSSPFERLLDFIIGTSSLSFYESPFKSFYFSKERSRKEYLNFLGTLKSFVGAIREYKSGQIFGLKDVLRFIDIFEKNNLQISSENVLLGGVRLLSAHSAKGLEFEVVFVIGATYESWEKGNLRDILPFPKNLNIKQENDDEDDKVRLFYVAITRSKKTLYITKSNNLKGNSILPSFISDLEDNFKEEIVDREEVLEKTIQSIVSPPYMYDEKKIIEDLLKDYKMPVTHLNNFLDIVYFGPELFMEQNLFHFPQAKTPNNVYGTAMHFTIDWIYNFLKKENKLPDFSIVSDYFKKNMIAGRLSDLEEKKFTEKGLYNLEIFLKEFDFSKDDKTEVDFENQGVVLGEALLSGKIDKVSFNKDMSAFVLDWKTGKGQKSWDPKNDDDRLKVWKQRNQLMFYKILIENSALYHKYEVKGGEIFFLNYEKDKFYKLNMNYDKVEMERFSLLIQKVFQKIKSLDFKEISKYPKTYKGILEFENDLIEGNI